MATSTSTRFPSVSRRLRIPSRAAWLGARAANVRRRPVRLVATWLVTSLLILGAYLLAPVGVSRARALLPAPAVARVDTLALLARVTRSRAQLGRADVGLRTAREQALALAATTQTDGASALDSLQALGANLAALVQRARSIPLPESYRVLAASPGIRDDPRVGPLLDSLAALDRARAASGGGAVSDPAAIARTTASNAVGRDLVIIALECIERIVRALAAGTKPPIADSSAVETDPSTAPIDTTVLASDRARAAAALAAAQQSLDAGRRTNARRDSVATNDRTGTRLASLPILVLAAAVLAAFLAILANLIDEMRSPRLADTAEAERLSGLRVLTVARLRDVPPERARRSADRTLPRWIDPTSDEYRILAWHLTASWPQDGVVTVACDDPTVAAIVGANLAAVFAVDARSTLLVDADFSSGSVRTLLDLPNSPGLVAVMENRRKWSESLIPVPVGRSRVMHVFPSGHRERAPGPEETQAAVGEVLRAARRHDATVVVNSSRRALTFRSGDDVILCAVQGATRLATFARAVASLIDAGRRVRGVVIWQGPLPVPGPRAPAA